MRFITPIIDDHVISGRFGDYRKYAHAPKKKQAHEGIDYAATVPANAEVLVFAAQKGVIDSTGWDGKGYGNWLRVKHNDRYYTWYAHLKNKPLGKVGDVVDTDTVLGFMGSTGNSTGRHLHFTVQDMEEGLLGYVVDRVIDPYPLMSDKLDTLQISKEVYTVISRLIHL